MSVEIYNSIVNNVKNSIDSIGFFDSFSIEKRAGILIANQGFLFAIKQNNYFNSRQIHNLVQLNQKWVTQAKGNVVSNFILRLLGKGNEIDAFEKQSQKLLSKASKIDNLAGYGLHEQKISLSSQLSGDATDELEKALEKVEIRAIFRRFKNAFFKVKARDADKDRVTIKGKVEQLSDDFIQKLATVIASDKDSFWNRRNIQFIQLVKLGELEQ